MAQTIQDLTLLLLVSLPIILLFHKFKLPSVVGFLLAGMLIGPHGFQLIHESESVEQLAEIGVILLLFIIGLEFSLNTLVKNMFQILGTGTLQLLLTGGATFLVLTLTGMVGQVDPQQLFALSLVIALSSTAIVLKIITDRAELDTLHGRVCVGVLLFQDLCVVPFMLIIPLLSPANAGVGGWDLVLALLKAAFAVTAVFLVTRNVFPRILPKIVQTGSKEHLTLFVILIILGTGWLSAELGLTVAMGAFIAGMILSESEYHHQIILDILPLKEYFVSIFFTSIGMILNGQVFIESPWFFIGLALGVMALKLLCAFVAALLARNTPRISLIVGMRLAQVGEFSLILAAVALEYHVFDKELYQQFLVVTILTMMLTPFVIQGSSGWTLRLFRDSGADELESGDKDQCPLKDHVVIAGYDTIGQNMSKVLKEVHIAFSVIELDGELVKRALKEECVVYYGDATQRGTLIRAGIRFAKLIVISFPDLKGVEQTVKLARQLQPDIFIIVRTKYSSEVDFLTRAGANQVISSDFETSIEIFSRALREYGLPNNVIEQQVELVRLEGYRMLRGLSMNVESLSNFSTYLTASLSKSFQVLSDSWSKDKCLQDLDIKARSGASLIAVVRNNEVAPHPEPEFQIHEGDILILFGRHAQLDKTSHILQAGPPSDTNTENETGSNPVQA